MKARHKTQSAPLAMTFLLLGFVLVPASLKATGFNPSLSGMMQAWNQIAGVFGNGYQPVTTTEMLALNQTPASEPAAPANETCPQQIMLASLELPAAIESDAPAVITVNEVSVAKRPGRCHKSTKKVCIRKPVEKEFRIVAIDVQEMTSVEPVIPVEAFKELEKRAAAGRFDFTKMIKAMPLPKDVRVLWRAKQPVAPAAFHISRCEDNFVTKPEARKELRRRAFTTSFDSVPTEGPETSEL